MYEPGLSNEKIYQNMSSMGYGKEKITADSAEPKSIDQLKGYGLRVKGAEKRKRQYKRRCAVYSGTLKIVVHSRCVNFLTEISNYTWDKDKFGNKLNKPIDDFNHLMDAMRYALEKYINKGGKWIICMRYETMNIRIHNDIWKVKLTDGSKKKMTPDAEHYNLGLCEYNKQ